MVWVWKKIGYTDKKHEAGSMSSLQIPVMWSSSDCDEDQISALDNPNKAQHWRTGEFDWAANFCHSKLVLEGSYRNLELAFLENKLLEHCKKEREVDIISEEISVEEWKDKICVWQEQTTTSPSGKHLGHYKALLNRGPDDSQSDEGQVFHVKQQALVQAHVDMLNYAIYHRYSYK
eukprot:2830005-Ditylum_brightwellii.AAC.1